MKIINSLNNIEQIYIDNQFSFEKWFQYIDSINPDLKQLCFDDYNEVIKSGEYTFEKDYLPILNNVLKDLNLRNKMIESFESTTKNIEETIYNKLGRSVDVVVLLYVGLGNGAGWVTNVGKDTYCLLGAEKIMELNWCDKASMYGLIYHELGHVYQEQYGILERDFDNNRHKYLWQLFTEGIAMYFEQLLVGDFQYYHQDICGWKNWCDNNLDQIKLDFTNDLDNMTFENQRYFGDWVKYKDHSDVGYYLGTKFIHYICKEYNFNDILAFEIDKVEELYNKFIIEKIR